jgi:hypothetical protein
MYRILQHEKRTDNIRIGQAFEPETDMSMEGLVKTIINELATSRGIAPEEFGKYWSRIAIVDADTLAIIATVYSEEEPGRCALNRRMKSLDETDNLLDVLESLFETEQRVFNNGSWGLTDETRDRVSFLWQSLRCQHNYPRSNRRMLSFPMSDPCTRLSALVGILCEKLYPDLVSWRGLSVSESHPDSKIHFYISGEVTLDNLQKLIAHVRGFRVDKNKK